MNKFEEFRYKIETFLESLFSVFVFLWELFIYIIDHVWFFTVESIVSLWEKLLEKWDKLLIFLSKTFY